MTNALLLPEHLLDKNATPGESDYLTAQRDGQVRDDCSDYIDKCSMGFFEVMPISHKLRT